MRVKRLLPSYVGLSELQSGNVSSLKELLELPWIKPLADQDYKFSRFSCNRIDDHWLLMAESQQGAWRVEALASGDDAAQIINPLPVWTYRTVSQIEP
jgi:hypothetical protein